MNTFEEGAQPSQRDNQLVVDISVPGSYWAFQIATDVAQRGGDVELYTSEPGFLRADRTNGFPVHTIRIPFAIKQIGYQLPWLNRMLRFTGLNQPFQRWGDYLFDGTVARRLRSDRTGLFLGFAGSCRDSLRRANELGYVTAVERSSTHIRTQRDILVEEYERFGVAGQPISIGHVEREEEEYDTADYIITPSDFTVESFKDRGVDENKLIRIPFGANADFQPPKREHDGTFSVLFAGQVSLRKGVQYLLPAWDQLSLPNAELILAGQIDEAVSDIISEYKDDESIRFLGWVDDMGALYRDASAFVLPTLEEGSARVTYEAMAWGLPVVTTANSGWIGEDGTHGLEVEIRDTVGLSSAIRRLHDDEAMCRRFGRNGRTLIESGYTVDDYGDKLTEAYQTMLDQGCNPN